MKKHSFSCYDLLIVILGLLSYLLDTISDIFITIVFYLEGNYIWASVSLAFVSLSSVCMLLFSFRWHVNDRTLTWKTFLPHVVFLAPLHRYVSVLRLGYKSRQTRNKKDFDDALRANVDVSLLRLIEAFTESAPQLVLQLYIILKFNYFNWLIGVSMLFSLTSVAFSLTTYSDALRMAYKENYKRSWLGISILTIWQSWMILSRVTATVVFALVFHAWTFLAMGVHWILMTFWITTQNADYGETVCDKRMFNSISGYIYIFCFLNLKEGHARNRMTAFYCFILAENSLFMLLWFLYHPEGTPAWLEVTSLSVVFGGFVLGGILMSGYYLCCHPTSKTAQDKKDLTAYWFKRANSLPTRNREPVFEVNHSVARVADWLNASVSLSNNDLESRCLSFDNNSFNLSLPDILKNGTFFDRTSASDSYKHLNVTKISSGRKSCSKSPDWNGTVNSTRSHLSMSSSKPLIDYSPSVVSYCSNSRDTFSFTNHVVLDKDRSSSVNSMSNSERAFVVTGQNNMSKMSATSVTDDSFYASPEYKASNLSPLDPKKLWDESQSRLASQIIEIQTTTDLKRRTSESRVTWRKIDNTNLVGNDSGYRQKSSDAIDTDEVHNQSENHMVYSRGLETGSYANSFCQRKEDSEILESSNKENEKPQLSFIGLNSKTKRISGQSLLLTSYGGDTSYDSSSRVESRSGESSLMTSYGGNKSNMSSSRVDSRSGQSSMMTSYGEDTSIEFTSQVDSRASLSSFFGDISSFHITSPEVGKHCISSNSTSKLDGIDEESDEYNDSLRFWSKRMLARINKELQDGSTEYKSPDTTPSLTSSYVQEENSCSNNGFEYKSSYDSSNQSSSRDRKEPYPESSRSYSKTSSGLHSRHSTSDIGGTNSSDGSYQNRVSSTTDRSTDDSGYSVSKSQSLKCLNNDNIQNSLTFVTKIDSDSDIAMKMGSDNDFIASAQKSHLQRNSDVFHENSKLQTARSLPGLSYLQCDSDTTMWTTDESTANAETTTQSVRNTMINHGDSTVKTDTTVTGEEPVKSVRFQDQLKTNSNKPPPPINLELLSKSPYRPGKIIREDLTPVKLEKFSHSPLRPGTKKDSSLDITDFDDSPQRLGRSIDLFDCERYRNSIAERDIDTTDYSLDTPLRELKDSPYKFRSKTKTDVEYDKENKYLGHVGVKQKDNVRLSIPYHSNKENSKRDSTLTAVNINRKNSADDKCFTNLKPRTIVDDFKKKHTVRNTQKKTPSYSNDLSLYQSEAITNPCYSYSDTESEADISKRSHSSFHGKFSYLKTPVTAGEGKREALKRLDNSPGFSPILTPGDKEVIQSCDTDRNVVRPVVSTPRGLYKTGLRYIDDSPSTIEV